MFYMTTESQFNLLLAFGNNIVFYWTALAADNNLQSTVDKAIEFNDTDAVSTLGMSNYNC